MPFPEQTETERLLLRWPTASDAEEIFARYATDPEVTRYLSWTPHKSVDETIAFERQSEEGRKEGKSFDWLIRSCETNLVLGMIGLRIDGPRAHLGYCFARDAWGQGCATEAARCVVVTAFEEPSIWRVDSLCDAEHMASARVLEKAGLAYEGTLRRYMVLPGLGDVPRDMWSYAKVR